MKKRQAMKNYYDYLSGKKRKGCEYCYGDSSPILRNNENNTWVNASISISSPQDRYDKQRKLIVNISDPDENVVIDRVFTTARYCFNCGRKLK